MKRTLAVFCLLLVAMPAWAAPIAVATDGSSIITLTDEPCALKVKLRNKAVWTEGDKTWQGCFGVTQGVVVMFFDDTSIALFSASQFRPARSL